MEQNSTLHTSDFLRRCSIKQSIFDSSTKLRNIKQNILLEISSKWDTTFHDQSNDGSDGQQPDETQNTTAAITSSGSRKSKIRSVYGQPEVMLCSGETSCSNNNLNSNHWRSLDSLDTNDSGHDFGSNSTSCSDLRLFDYQCRHIKHQSNNNHNTETVASDLGTSVESSDNEIEPSTFGDETNYDERQRERHHSCNSSSSGCSFIECHQEEEQARYFMHNFVQNIFADR